LDRGAGRFLFDLIDGSERWGGDDAALLRLSRSDQVAAERPSHHAFELAAQRTFQIETIWPD
jgi:hypothetical protein